MGFRQNMNSGIAICMFQISQARNHNSQRGLAVRCGGRWVALVFVGEEICVVPWWFHVGSMPSCAIYDGLSSEWNEWPCVPWDFDSYVAEFWRENWRPHKEEKEGGTKNKKEK